MTRIISGIWRGQALPNLKTGTVRPTTDRARTILFDTLRYFQGLKVLDLFSGTGALGIEALSRGAESVLSIDSDPKYVSAQREWFATREGQFRVQRADVHRFLPKLRDTYDIIFADPPYDETFDDQFFTLIDEHLNEDGTFVYERRRTDQEDIAVGRLTLYKEKTVADTRIQFYKVAGT